MKHLAGELMWKVEQSAKDFNDLNNLFHRATVAIEDYRKNHSLVAGVAEAAIGITATAVGASLFNPVDMADKIPELIGAAFGTGVGGAVGSLTSLIGGIGVVMMGTGFGIPVAAVTAIGASVGALSGLVTGWFGVELATHTMSLTEAIFANISGSVLVAFGCCMLFLAMKDLWRAGGEFVSYLRGLGINEIVPEDFS